jgi:hypothetical protein
MSHVSGRRVPALLVASLGVGVLIATLAATHGVAQTTRIQGGMRSTLDGEPEDARARAPKQAKRTKSIESGPIGQVPKFGNPAGSGAGKTGFVSVTAPKRKAKAKSESTTQTGQAQNQPLPLTPAGIVITPDQAVSAEKSPPPAAKKTKQPTKTAAKVVTAPRAPALIAREQAKEQLNTLPNTVVPLRRRPVIEEDPFAPLGIHTGAFIVRPAIETSGGYDTNPARVKDGRGSTFITVAPELAVRSDWERHGLAIDLRGSHTWYQSTPEQDRPSLDARAVGRIDVTERTRAELEGHYVVGTDNPGSPNIQAGLAELPLFHTIGGSATVAHRFNRLELALRGTVDHTEYDESHLTDGTVVSNAGRNFDQYGGQFRAAYELTPGIKPFAQVDVDTRVYARPIDAGGVPRDSDGISGRLGTSFELSRLLTGEIAVGYIVRDYKDPALRDLGGLLVDASLVWRATGLTTVAFSAKTTANESTLVDVSGVLSRDFTLQVDHLFRRWLLGTVKLGYGLDDYVGSSREDERYTASAALTYKLNRAWWAKGELRQEWRTSNVEGQDYAATIAMVGLRWQP